MKHLRPYQIEALNNSVRDRQAGVSRQLICLPTGTGKTAIISNLPGYHGLATHEQMLFIVDRDELVHQSLSALREWNPTHDVGGEKAQELFSNPANDLIVLSMQSMTAERLRRFNPERVRIVAVDEADLAANDQRYREIFKYFRVLKGYPDLDNSKLLIGCTATPNRHDGIGLEVLFDTITFQMSIRDAIEQGWLCGPVSYRAATRTDLSAVKTAGGDFAKQALSYEIDTPGRNKQVVEEYTRHGEQMPLIGFTEGIDHAVHLAETFQAAGIEVYPVSSRTPREERRRLIDRMRSRKIDGLTSCDALSRGTDLPVATVGLMSRPTKSESKYIQMAGRVLRPHPAPEELSALRRLGAEPDWVKKYAIIIDFADNAGRHSLVTLPTLFGLRPDFNAKGEPIVKAAKQLELLESDKGIPLRDYDSIEAAEMALTRVDLLKAPTLSPLAAKYSGLGWMELAQGVAAISTHKDLLLVKQDALGRWQVFQSRKGKETLKFQTSSAAQAFAEADKLVPKEELILMQSKAAWHREEPSEKQSRVVYGADKRISGVFADAAAFHNFVLAEHRKGNTEYSKGGMSRRISGLAHANPKLRRRLQYGKRG